MAFAGLSWKHFIDTFLGAEKAIDSVVDMNGKKADSDKSKNSAESSSYGEEKGILTSGPPEKILLLKRKKDTEVGEQLEDGETVSKKSSFEGDSPSESDTETNGALKLLSSLTGVIIKPVLFLKKAPVFPGIDSWVPADGEQILEVPEELFDSYKKVHPNVEAPKKFVLMNGEFSVLTATDAPQIQTPCKNNEDNVSREEKLADNELNADSNNKEKTEKKEKTPDNKKPLYHLAITLYNKEQKRYVMSLFRSQNLADVVALCERCRENPELFRIFPKASDVNIKDYLHTIFTELRENMTWKSVHISAKIGLIEYLKNVKSHKMERKFNTVAQPEGLTPLMIAVQNDHREIIEFLVENGADINSCLPDGSNIIHIAATSTVETIKFLWETKKCATMLNKSDANGNSPMYIALTNGYLTNARFMSSLGATMTATDATHEATPLIGAIKKGKLDEATLKKILEIKPDALNEKEATTGNSALHCATSKKCVILLLEKYADQVDLNSRNSHKQTALHVFVTREDMGLIMTICAYPIDINAEDCNGNTPLHLACAKGNLDIARQLLCLGADPNKSNHYRETTRHISARLPAQDKAIDLVKSLIICGGKACQKSFVGCAFGCMDKECLETCKAQMNSCESSVDEKVDKINVSSQAASAAYEFVLDPDTRVVEEAYAEKNETRSYPHKQAMEKIKQKLKEVAAKKDKSNVINVLALDGGGIRGLVTVQMLICLENFLEKPLADYFDWIAATSTGTYIMSTMLVGETLRMAQKYYLQFKDQLFDSWSRPYDAAALEQLIMRVFGQDRKMSDIHYPKIFCTTVRADTFPVQLDLCRNYRLPVSDDENEELGFIDPKSLTLWKACRRSSAAPTYFSASEGKYIDGGMISNNPTLDLMSEICFWNSTCQKTGNVDKMVEVGCVLSVGTGVTPICPVDPSLFEMSDLMGLLRGIKNLSLVVIDQATATEGAHITRSRSWCHSLGIPYFRFNAPLFKDIILDTTDDRELSKIMWDSIVYAHTHKKDFEEVASLLKLVGTTEERQTRLKT